MGCFENEDDSEEAFLQGALSCYFLTKRSLRRTDRSLLGERPFGEKRVDEPCGSSTGNVA